MVKVENVGSTRYIIYNGKRYEIISTKEIQKEPGTIKIEIVKTRLLTKDFAIDQRSKSVCFRIWTSVANKQYMGLCSNG